MMLALTWPFGALLTYLTKRLRDRFVTWLPVRPRTWLGLSFIYALLLAVWLGRAIGLR